MFRNSYCFFFFFLVILVSSCNSDDSQLIIEANLAKDITNREFVVDNVIACAASNMDFNVVSIFLYPRESVTNISFYETESVDVDKNDFSAYSKGEGELIDVFNGYLLKYEIVPEKEKWIIVTFEEEDKVHLSNPIRLKQNTKPTEYLPENVTVVSNSIMPIFIWQDGMFDDSKIYFHVISNSNNDLLSGTYTFDKMFQFYNLDNVVLNITEQEPSDLDIGSDYSFTLLAVSEDNWVNLFSEITFNVQ